MIRVKEVYVLCNIMHHTPTMYGGLDADGYGQTAISLVNDGSGSSALVPNSEGNNNCAFFNGQTNVITDGWAVSYTNGLTPMKQMEGEERAKNILSLFD